MSDEGALPELPDLPSDAPAARPRRTRRAVVGGVAAVALVAGGVAVTMSVMGSSGGPRTPEAAVHDFVAAAEDEDLLGLLETIDPLERDALRAAFEGAQAEGQRLDLLADSFSLGGVQGIDLLVQQLELETQTLGPDLAVVEATDGYLVAEFDKETFPVGAAIGDIGTGSARERIDVDEIEVGEGSGPLLATVQRDGEWYVSVSYTLAEYLRRYGGLDAPEPGTGVAAVGTATAEEAATLLAQRLSAGDWAGVAALAAPGEGDALRLYAPLLMEAFASYEDGFAFPTALTLSGVQWDVSGDGVRAVARPVAYTVEGTLPSPYDTGDAPPFDPTLPTVIQSPVLFDPDYSDPMPVGTLVIPAGEPVPELVDFDTAELTPWDELPLDANFAVADEEGNVTGMWSDGDAEQDDGDLSFRAEHADGCTTFSGEAFEGPNDTYGIWLEILYEETNVVDGGVRACDQDRDPLFGLYGMLGLGVGFDAVPQAVSLVQVGGQWYVSPLGTLTGTLVEGLRSIQSAGFDSPLAFWLYDTSRQNLEDSLDGESRDSLAEACVAIAEFDGDGDFVRIIDAPDPAATRACYDEYWNDDDYDYDDDSYSESAEEVCPTAPPGYPGCEDYQDGEQDDQEGESLPTMAPETTPWRTVPPASDSGG